MLKISAADVTQHKVKFPARHNFEIKFLVSGRKMAVLIDRSPQQNLMFELENKLDTH